MINKEKLLEATILVLQEKLTESIDKDFFNVGAGNPGYHIDTVTQNYLLFNHLDDFKVWCYDCNKRLGNWVVSGNNLIYDGEICEHKVQNDNVKQNIDKFYNDICVKLDEIIDKYKCYEIESIIFNFGYYLENGKYEKVQKIFKPTPKEQIDSEINSINDKVKIQLTDSTKHCFFNLPNFGKSIKVQDINGNELHIGDIVKYRDKLCVVRIKGESVILTKIGNYNDNYASSSLAKSELVLTYKSSCIFKTSSYYEEIKFISKSIRNCLEVCSEYNIEVSEDSNSNTAHFDFGGLTQKNYGWNILSIYPNDEKNRNADILGLLKRYKLI